MTAILDRGFVGKQVRPSIIALLASVLLALSAVVGIVAALPDGVPTSDEELIEPEWLTTSEEARDVAKFRNCASLFGCYVPSPSYFDAELEADALEHQTLLASLSPGMRAVYLGGIRDRRDALEQEWTAKRQRRERDEAEYAAFIEEHLRRLNEERPSRK